jgi:prefoldin subunit 5
VYDLAAKAEAQKSIKAIEDEIDDLKKESHDLGLKISRAWRRLDENENAGDGNNLWVKRVTS